MNSRTGKRPFVALLRGINVGGNRILPMEPLKSLCTDLGWAGVRTLLQSGNIVFAAGGSARTLEQQLERGIQERFGFAVDAVVLEAAAFKGHLAKVPFSGQTARDPSRVLVYFPKRPPAPGAREQLQERAQAGEVVATVDGVLWVHFPKGVGTSKLTPAAIDRAVGSPATGRNWNTLTKLEELTRAFEPD